MLSPTKGNALRKLLFPVEKPDFTSQEVFGQLFQQTHVQIYRYLYGLTGGPQEDVEDLVHESFTRAWFARHSFRGDFKDALHWLLKIAKNEMINSYRRQKSSGETESLDADELHAPDSDPESQVLSGELHQTLWGLVQLLPEGPREMLILRYMLDWPIAEIATYMNKGETAISMAIHRALNRLQQDWPIESSVTHTRS